MPRTRASLPERVSARRTGPRTPTVTTDSGSALERLLSVALALTGLPAPQREFMFHPTRKWRVDFCWPEHMLAVEIEGGIYRGGSHTSVTGLKRDIAKGNALTMAGYRLLRFHGDQVRSGEAVRLIAQALGLAAHSYGQHPQTEGV